MESRFGISFQVSEHIDIYDIVQKRWFNGEIVHIDVQNKKIKVHYSRMSHQYDEILDFSTDRIQKQWKKGMPFKIGNRLDILETQFHKWMEATVVEISNDQQKIKVHYKGYASNKDELVDVVNEANRILEVGSISDAEGWAKYSARHQQEIQDVKNIFRQSIANTNVSSGNSWGMQTPSQIEQEMKRIDWRKEDEKFAKLLYEKRLRIIEMGRDGNCLFRSIAHQAYGDEDEHKMVRQKCMDYILSEKEYFKDFIIGGGELNVEAYVSRKRMNAVWGDDVEIQALSEIYNRPIEIYAYSGEPMRTFHEQDGSNEPFKLSYHGKSHYNSIVAMDWTYEKVFVSSSPGELEDEAIKMSKLREEQTTENQKTLSREQKISEQNIRIIAQTIMRSREDFQIQGKKDMEQVLLASIKEINSTKRDIESENVQKAMMQSQLEQSEEELIRQAMEQSLQEERQRSKVGKRPGDSLRQADNILKNMDLNDALMQTFQAVSNSMPQTQPKTGGQSNNTNLGLSPGVIFAMQNGFSYEQGYEAVLSVGENQDFILNYLFNKYCL